MKRILVVDNDEGAHLLLKTFLKNESYLIEEARNGEEALSKLKESSFDLLITDMIMPEMDGIELLNHIDENNIDIKVIATSRGMRRMDADHFLHVAQKSKSCRGTLSKPFDDADLIGLIKKILP